MHLNFEDRSYVYDMSMVRIHGGALSYISTRGRPGRSPELRLHTLKKRPGLRSGIAASRPDQDMMNKMLNL
jgi:hypothetical protein